MATVPGPFSGWDSGSRVGVVVAAAGSSTRMGGADKIFAPILGIPLLAHTLDQFEEFPPAAEVALVLEAGSLDLGRDLLSQRGYRKKMSICAGGQRRQDSVRNGLESLGACDWVIVHDGARPCLDQPLLWRALEAAQEYGASAAGVPVNDTIKIVSEQGMVQATPDRRTLWAAQTPQVFRYGLIREAHRHSTQAATDDAMMVESLGHPVKMFTGSYDNLKVTTPGDLIWVEAFLRSRVAAAG